MTSAILFKRPFDLDAVVAHSYRPAKRPRSTTTTTVGRRPLVVDRSCADSSDDPNDCDDGDDSEVAQRLAHAVASHSDDDDAIDKMLCEISPDQMMSAMLTLVDDAVAFGRLCGRAAKWPRGADIPLVRVLRGAAQRGYASAVAALVGVSRSVDVISEALLVCLQDDNDDPRAVAVIVEACEVEPKVTVSAYREIIRYALRDAVHLGRVHTVAYLADVAEPDDLKRHLQACAMDQEDPCASMFGVLWRPLGLCAHAYAAALPRCPALNYLVVATDTGVPCPGDCVMRPRDHQRDAHHPRPHPR